MKEGHGNDRSADFLLNGGVAALRPLKRYVTTDLSNRGDKIIDIVFDIDGTLANAKHRLHHIIPDPNAIYEQPFRKDWDRFLSNELVAKDEPIEQTWAIMNCLLTYGNQVIFITGRPEKQRSVTTDWLLGTNCLVRRDLQEWVSNLGADFNLYMRKNGDRRLSHIVKGELLEQARQDGFDPKLAFEDRIEDTKMWREKGLMCCQVAEGNY